MNPTKRLKALEAAAARSAALQSDQTQHLRPEITKDEWLELAAVGSDFGMADLERVIQQRATKEVTV